MKFLKQLFKEILNLLFSIYNNKLKLFGISFTIIIILSLIYVQNFSLFLFGILGYIWTTILVLFLSLLVPSLIYLLVLSIMAAKSYYHYYYDIFIDFGKTKYPILNSILCYGSIIGTYCCSLYIGFIKEAKQEYIELTKTYIMPVFDNLYILEDIYKFIFNT